MYRNQQDRLKLYRESLGFAWGFVDYNDWPIKLNSAFHLFLEEFGEEFLEDLTFLEKEAGFSLKEIAEPFYNPARIYRIIDSVIYSMRRNRHSLQYQREITLKMLSMVKALKYGSEFNEDGRNIIYPPEKIHQLVDMVLANHTCSMDESRFIHRFCGLIWAYTESIFFRAHDATKEIHGPYYYNDNKQKLVIKEYLNLHPDMIWPEVTLLPCNTIKIVKNYNENIKIKIDALNHLYHEGGQPVSNLSNYYIEIDGKRVTIEDLKKLISVIEKTITEISNQIKQMSWHQKVMKYAEIFWFRKKPLRDARGLCWQVPAQVREQINNGEENPKRLDILGEEQVYRLAMLTI